jgi:hypothetical protein
LEERVTLLEEQVKKLNKLLFSKAKKHKSELPVEDQDL